MPVRIKAGGEPELYLLSALWVIKYLLRLPGGFDKKLDSLRLVHYRFLQGGNIHEHLYFL
jgi:hypothetical protein